MFVSRILRKESTGLVGLNVAKNPRPTLIKLYNDTLTQLQDIPESAIYRQSVAAITQHRLNIVESTESVEEIEDKVASGQIEQLIAQAKTELSLIQKMKSWKPWEPLQTPEPEKQWGYGYKSG